VRPA